MMKRVLFLATLLAVTGTFLSAKTMDENLLVNDDKIFALSNKYTSMISALYEEETAHLGLNVYNYDATLVNRDAKTESDKTKILEALLQNLNEVKPKSLSTYARADYYTLKELIDLKYFDITVKNQLELDPLWYLEPLDTIYEVLLRNFLSGQDRLDYAFKRLSTIPEVLQKAENNLTKPYDLNSKLAIEKIDLEITNIPALNSLILRISDDKLTKERLTELTKQATNALKEYKVFLQNKLNNQQVSDFRIGENNYKNLFKIYNLPYKYSNLQSLLNKNYKKALESLISEIGEKVIATLSEEQLEERFVKGKFQIYAKDYYLLAKENKDAPKYDKLLQTYSDEITKTDEFLVKNKLFPTLTLPLVLTPAPPIFRDGPFQIIFYPPAPMADRQEGNILVSLPKANNLNKEKYNLNYNYSKIKLNTSEFITPGLTLIYSAEPAHASLLYKLSNDIFYIHGWIKYAVDTAYENNFFNEETDKLNYLWFNYKKAVYALVDYELQTKNWNYDSALAFIKEAGIEENEAKPYLDYLALRPFDAVSYILGAKEFNRLKTKYQKKLGKDFDLLTFNAKILSVGRIPLKSLEESLAKTYTKQEIDNYFSMTYY